MCLRMVLDPSSHLRNTHHMADKTERSKVVFKTSGNYTIVWDDPMFTIIIYYNMY